MRPHRLRVTAFGAFGGTVEVCFDDLASAGLFLLHGETGAGKTTLLDAIGFALYGRVPGERAKARRLRSDHAAPGTSTEVQLEATMGGRRMRITRKPEQQRPKRRGGGTTTEQAKILLEESDGGRWRAVSTRAGEADDEIKDLMGMSAEQFYQVVLLPQGEFAQFLHADAADREPSCCKSCSAPTGSARSRTGSPNVAAPRPARWTKPRQAVRELAARVAQVAGAARAPGPHDGPGRAARSRLGPAPGRGRRRRGRGQRRPASAPAARSWTRPRTASAPPSAWPTVSAAGPTRCAPATSSTRPRPASRSSRSNSARPSAAPR